LSPIELVPLEPSSITIEPTGFMDGLWPPPGILGGVARWAYGAMPLPDRGSATAVGIVAMASANRNKYVIDGPLGLLALNVNVVCVGETGSGKEGARSALHRVAKVLGFADTLAEGAASAPGILRRLVKSEALLTLTPDEYGAAVMQAMKQSREVNHQAGVVFLLMEMFGRATGRYSGRVYAREEDNIPPIERPYLCSLATSTAATLGEAVADQQVANGFTSRLLAVPLTDPLQLRRPDLGEPPAVFGRAFEFDPGNAGQQGTQLRLPLAPGVREAWEAFYRETRTLGGVHRDVWNRAAEYALRLAGLLAIGTPTKAVSIESWLWAEDFVRRCFGHLSQLHDEKSAPETQHDKNARMLLSALRPRPGKGRTKPQDAAIVDGWAPRSVALRYSHLDAVTFERTLRTLQLGGQVEVIKPDRAELIRLAQGGD
jgi:hypothetical protein